MRIILVRHGDPDYVKDCLTELGKKQAEVAAARLMCEGIDEIWSSSSGRAYETAQAFSARSGISPIHQLDFMREIRFGYGEALYSTGNPWDETDRMSKEGEEILIPKWQELPFFKDNAAVEDVDMIAKETDNWMRGLGYEREGLYYRCKRADDQEYTVVLFAHGGSGSAMLARLLNLPFFYICGLIRMEHTAITIVRFLKEPGSMGMPVLELCCDSRHIRGVELRDTDQ
ncbi:MAG: histidine phosphatase family protein [Clostridiales bacterium]|nr:histidine phosphatase family protein [Clostridiales bacterium]